MTPSEIIPVPGPLADAAFTLRESLIRSHEIQKRRLEVWTPAIEKAPPANCQRHPNRQLAADVERSAFESAKARSAVVVYQPCPDCDADEQARKAERRLIMRGIPARSLGITLATWEAEWEPTFAKQRRQALASVIEWTNGRPPVPFLIVLGAECGSGKTALGVAALRAFGSEIRCLDYRDWIDGMVGMDAADRRGALESVRGYSALMIDDVGNRFIGGRDSDGGNNMERDALAAVLNYRFENRLPCILTSNLEAKDFIRRFDPRTVDRIRAGRVVIDASKWPSRRAAEGI